MNPLPPEWSSYALLIQELINGKVRRNLFTRWELDLLLDVQMAGKRKSSRSEALRRYLRIVQQGPSSQTPGPLRFADFLASQPARRAAAGGGSG